MLSQNTGTSISPSGNLQITADDGVTLRGIDWGSGRPIIFLHGFAMNGASWDYHMFNLVKDGFRCITFDKRGHGLSDKPWASYTYDRLADDLSCVIESLNLSEVVLIGHSMAGGEIMRYLSRHGGSKISKVVLTSPCLPFVLKTDNNPDGTEAAVFDQYAELLLKDPANAYKTVLGPAFFGDFASPEMLDWAVRIALQTCLPAVISCMATYSQADFRAELPNISTPVLILHGDADPGMPIEFTSEKAAALLPNCTLKSYKDGPHAIYLTHREQFLQDVRAFLKS